MDVALVSCVEPPEPDPDEDLLVGALRKAGIDAEVVGWDDPAIDWSRPRLSVLRSTWNYTRDHPGFLRWAGRAARESTLWNPLPVVRWNSHKGYLSELGSRGIPVVPTVVLERGSETTLRQVLRERGWSEAVVKPAVSAASYGTIRVAPESGPTGEAHLRSLLADRDVLVQRYLPSVESYGERSLIWIDGELTHAVRKGPRFAGEKESVSATAVPMTQAEVTLAGQALGSVSSPLLYARVDMTPGPQGEPLLMELELIEPSLYLTQYPGALRRLVSAIGDRLRDVVRPS